MADIVVGDRVVPFNVGGQCRLIHQGLPFPVVSVGKSSVTVTWPGGDKPLIFPLRCVRKAV